MAGAKTTKGGKPEPLSMLEQQFILTETIKKEMRHHKLTTNFTINPFNPMHTVTGKPHSFIDAQLDKIKGDELLIIEQMKEVIKRSRLPPTQKHIYPQTTSQEYGWISTPVIELDRSDTRLHHPRHASDVTIVKEAMLKIGDN